MDLARMIAELQDERQRLNEAIEALERLSAGQSKRRGRPPRTLSEDPDDAVLAEVQKSDSALSRGKKFGEETDAQR